MTNAIGFTFASLHSRLTLHAYGSLPPFRSILRFASLQARETLNPIAHIDLLLFSFGDALSAVTALLGWAAPLQGVRGDAPNAQPAPTLQVGMPSAERADHSPHSDNLISDRRDARPLAFALPPAPLPPPQNPPGKSLPTPHTQQGSSNVGGRSQGKLRVGLGLGAQRRSRMMHAVAASKDSSPWKGEGRWGFLHHAVYQVYNY